MARLVLDTNVASLSYKARLPSALGARIVGQEVVNIEHVDHAAALIDPGWVRWWLGASSKTALANKTALAKLT